jgi:hypothetical protein
VRSCRVVYGRPDANTLVALKDQGLERVGVRFGGRGLHSFPFQLNFSSFVHRMTQLNS